ncbi:MAG: TRAP transporter small permease subunit [Proteobacteria bacterium]|nr:TRAP transporter small permease subunit [Pseudomonadota bacterium]
MSHVAKILRAVEQLNDWSGKLLALITPVVIAITVYEVVMRYAFNAPTNWAHELSTLLFGVQYILCGAYAHYHHQHVNVDVLSHRWPPRWRAWVDVVTSSFFFLFVGALAYTSWTFAIDSWNLREVSVTDWAPPFYPVKIAIFIAFILLGLQGMVKLIRDLHLGITGRELS